MFIGAQSWPGAAWWRPALDGPGRNDRHVRGCARRVSLPSRRRQHQWVERRAIVRSTATHQPNRAGHLRLAESLSHSDVETHIEATNHAGHDHTYDAAHDASHHAGDDPARDDDTDTDTDTDAHAVSETAGERADLVQALDRHRSFLRNTLRGLTDEQAASRTTASELTLAGLIKHVAVTERGWSRFIIEGPSAMGAPDDEQAMSNWLNGFRMLEGETVEALLRGYDAVARETDKLVLSLPDLDASQPLPSAPWFEPGARWSARRVFLHIIAETSQHAGHADIIRESLDGAKSMG